MKNRKFGVEIECGIRGVERWSMHQTARSILANAGYNMGGSVYSSEDQWSVGFDGTGAEVRTPPLCGPEGFKTLKNVMELLTKNGGYVTSSDGMHVHHDAPEFLGQSNEALENRKRLERSWEDNEDLIKLFVAKRRRNSGACPTYKSIKSQSWYDDIYGYRAALNLGSLTEHGTIEFRLHEGTLDFEQASAWIRFGQYFLNSVLNRKKPIICCDNTQQLLNRIKASQTVKRQLKERQ